MFLFLLFYNIYENLEIYMEFTFVHLSYCLFVILYNIFIYVINYLCIICFGILNARKNRMQGDRFFFNLFVFYFGEFDVGISLWGWLEGDGYSLLSRITCTISIFAIFWVSVKYIIFVTTI